MTPTSSRGETQKTDIDARQRPVAEMSADELRRKTKSIVDEYLHLNDLKV